MSRWIKTTSDIFSPYSLWHREIDGLAYVNIDSIEICKRCQEPLAVIETDSYKGDYLKRYNITARVAYGLNVPGYVLLYEFESSKNEGDDNPRYDSNGVRIVAFHVKRIFPDETEYKILSPDEWRKVLEVKHKNHVCIKTV